MKEEVAIIAVRKIFSIGLKVFKVKTHTLKENKNTDKIPVKCKLTHKELNIKEVNTVIKT